MFPTVLLGDFLFAEGEAPRLEGFLQSPRPLVFQNVATLGLPDPERLWSTPDHFLRHVALLQLILGCFGMIYGHSHHFRAFLTTFPFIQVEIHCQIQQWRYPLPGLDIAIFSGFGQFFCTIRSWTFMLVFAFLETSNMIWKLVGNRFSIKRSNFSV